MPRGRSTVHRPRLRATGQQEPSTSSLDRNFPNKHFAQQNRAFATDTDLAFERDYMLKTGFPGGDRRNNNFQRNLYNPSYGPQQNQEFFNTNPRTFNYPSFVDAQTRPNQPKNYPNSDWQLVVPGSSQPGPSRLPQQNQQMPPKNTVPIHQQSVSSQILMASQYNPNQNQFKKRNLAQNNTGPRAGSSQASTTSERRPSQGSNISQELKEVMEHYKMYTCPCCHENYTFKYHQTRLVGKLPLILYCSHTVCQECVYKKVAHNKLNCPVCNQVNTLPSMPICMSDLQKPFPPNFHILGMLFFSRPPGGFLGNLDNIKFVVDLKKKGEVDVKERCCFGKCAKEAKMYCPNCDGIYCTDCCTVVHKSAKTLMSHEPVPREARKFSLKLEYCRDHKDMLVEFYCKNCDQTSCCYCILDHHQNHERVPLCQLTDSEKEEFKIHKEQAIVVLKEVLTSQKKASKLSNFSTADIKREIAAHFADRHAKLFSMEKRLFDELSEVKACSKSLETIQASLKETAQVLKKLVSVDPARGADEKLNVRGALQKLKDIENEPRFLLNNEGVSEPVRFINNFEPDQEAEMYQIIRSEDAEFKLVAKDDLPEDYVFDNFSDVEVELEEITRSAESTRMSLLDNTKIRQYPTSESSRLSKGSSSQKNAMDRVEVQHINSMDSFFVQYKNTQSKLNALNKEIENYVKMGGAENVPEPELNSCYLILYIVESHGSTVEQKWFRAKVVDEKNKNGEVFYEAFFIDYGKTQFVKGNRIRNIPQFLLKHTPFAVECRLHNPMLVDWDKKAHLNMAKILNGKTVFMTIRSTEPSGILAVDLMVSSSGGSLTSVIDILVFTTKNNGAAIEETLSENREAYQPQLKVFPNSKRFTKNQTHKVILANVIDPDNIFVHIEAHRDAFKNMTSMMKKACKNSKRNQIVPIEGTYVLLEYKDPIRSNWHRAFIKSVDHSADQVHAVLVDWGLTVCVPTSNIRPMMESFTKLEAQAVLVKLAHIAPFNRQATWHSQAITFLQTFLTSQDVLKMVVHEADIEVSVALFDLSNSTVEICINALLVDQNLADSTGPISTQAERPLYDEAESARFQDDEGVIASMLRKVDEADEDSGEEDCRQIAREPIDVVKLISPDEIYVKFLSFRDKEAKLYKELNVQYDKERETKEAWNKDDKCVVQVHPSEYNRARIIDGGPDVYKVFLMDTAEEVEVPLDRIFVLLKYFSQLPNVAIRSHLANIRPAGDTGKWPISATEALQAIFQKRKRFYARKAEEADSNPARKSMPLDMWYGILIPGGALEPDHMKYVCINQSLVRMGYAYKKPSLSVFEKAIDSIARPKADSSDFEFPLLELNKTDDNKSSDQNFDKKIEDLSKNLIEKMKKSATSSASSTKTVTAKSKKLKKTRSKKGRKDSDSSTKKESGSETDKETTEVFKKKSKIAEKTSKLQWIDLIEAEVNIDPAEPSTSRAGLPDDSKPGKSSDSDVTGRKADPSEVFFSFNRSEDSPYHRKEVDITDWLPPFGVAKREFRARVTCVETSGGLYMHEETIHDAYQQIEANIKAYFDTNPPKTEDEDYWQPGRICTIKYDDGKWYRGRVLRVKSPDKITVFMIDFGSDHDVSPDCLYREVLYADIEAFATKVKLDRVYAKNGQWLSSDYDAFIDLVTDWCQIKVKGPINVEIPLVEVINDAGVNVNEELLKISQNLVKNLTIGAFPESDDDGNEALLIEEEVHDEYLSTEERDNENHEEPDAEDDFEAADNEAAEKQDVNTVSCNDMLDWQYQERALPMELHEGQTVRLEVVGLQSYNQVALKERGLEPTEEFYNLIIDIQDCADTMPQLTDLQIGVPCIAPFSEDGVWYRARISNIDNLPLGKVQVYFVDYGNSELVDITEVRTVRPEWLRYPQQTWELRLGFDLDDPGDEDEVYQAISRLTGTSTLVKLGTGKAVHLLDQDALCYQNLVDLGLITLDSKP